MKVFQPILERPLDIPLFILLVPSTKTSWADEDIDLPSARTKFLLPLHSYLSFPLAMGVPEGSEEPGRGLGRFPPSGDRSGRGGRDQGPPPPPVLDYARIPTMAPFNSFVGNLPFEVNETNLSEFFSALKIREIKIPLDQEQRCRGFAYVEFVDQDSLIKGLLMSGQV